MVHQGIYSALGKAVYGLNKAGSPILVPLRRYSSYGLYLFRTYYPTFAYVQANPTSYVPAHVQYSGYLAVAILLGFLGFENWNVQRRADARYNKLNTEGAI